jgi:hypothetical protein
MEEEREDNRKESMAEVSENVTTGRKENGTYAHLLNILDRVDLFCFCFGCSRFVVVVVMVVGEGEGG